MFGPSCGCAPKPSSAAKPTSFEAFVRHNLTVVDHLAIVDHGSFDGTSEILAELIKEGLPLEVTRDERVGFFQPEVLTPLARDLLRDHDADFVFVLDADEFLKVDDPLLASITLRYTHLARGDAFAMLLKFAERLARG